MLEFYSRIFCKANCLFATNGSFSTRTQTDSWRFETNPGSTGVLPQRSEGPSRDIVLVFEQLVTFLLVARQQCNHLLF